MTRGCKMVMRSQTMVRTYYCSAEEDEKRGSEGGIRMKTQLF